MEVRHRYLKAIIIAVLSSILAATVPAQNRPSQDECSALCSPAGLSFLKQGLGNAEDRARQFQGPYVWRGYQVLTSCRPEFRARRAPHLL